MSKFIIGPAGLINTDYITEVTAHGTEGTLPATQEKSEPALSAKAAKKAAMRELQAKLKAIWGHLFGRADIPLAIGIRHDIARHLSPAEQKVLPAVLHQHVHRPAYLAALQQPGAHRVDLHGNLSEITAEQVAHAKEV